MYILMVKHEVIREHIVKSVKFFLYIKYIPKVKQQAASNTAPR